jgi:hypothetical protein
LRNLSNVISVSQLIFFERRYVAYTTDGKKNAQITIPVNVYISMRRKLTIRRRRRRKRGQVAARTGYVLRFGFGAGAARKHRKQDRRHPASHVDRRKDNPLDEGGEDRAADRPSGQIIDLAA